MAAAAPDALMLGGSIGRQIFVYRKIDTNQIVYSMTRSLRNKLAMRQLTFVGKKSVPAALRKDMWTPLCVVSFPNALQGNAAFRQLLEFKHLHEVAYPEETLQDPKRPAGLLVPKKEQTKILQDQKANSIADIAHVLAMHKRPPTEAEIKHARMMVYSEGVKRRPKGAPLSKYRPGKKHTSEILEFRGKLAGVSIWWADPLDAEFAETWPEEVLHGPLLVGRHTAIWPPPEEVLLGKRPVPPTPGHNGSHTAPSTPGQSPSEPAGRWSRWFGGGGAAKAAEGEAARQNIRRPRREKEDGAQ